MIDGIHNEGDSRVRVKHNAIYNKASRPWGFLDRSHVGDM